MCSCRHNWHPVCQFGVPVAANLGCAECRDQRFDNTCAVEEYRNSIHELDCGCGNDLDPVCSTITGEELSRNSCEAKCKGYKSYVPCRDLPNRDSNVPYTGVPDLPLPRRTCSSVGPFVGDVAGIVGCNLLKQECMGEFAHLDAPNWWKVSLSVIPTCFSGDTTDCYSAATDWALDHAECAEMLAEDGPVCKVSQARQIFGSIVSRVCAEEPRDKRDFE
mmetsp:Transcript_32812/g.77777  ORF Transcript_32812/g.77777 Transcript_32812/m.77777 type:complete len:219 (+) Transcript_32812:674-1330(+)